MYHVCWFPGAGLGGTYCTTVDPYGLLFFKTETFGSICMSATLGLAASASVNAIIIIMPII